MRTLVEFATKQVEKGIYSCYLIAEGERILGTVEYANHVRAWVVEFFGELLPGKRNDNTVHYRESFKTARQAALTLHP